MAHAAPTSIKTSVAAEPGTKPVSTAHAREVFQSLCISAKGSPEGTEAAAAKAGFVKNTKSGTYVHPREDLSVKLGDGYCAMFFYSQAPGAELKAALLSLAPNGKVSFEFRGNYSGQKYYHVDVPAK
jgi:hypothetical protein